MNFSLIYKLDYVKCKKSLKIPNPPIKLTARYSLNIVESGAKHHQTNKQAKETI
jgi:hypothetical protein